MTLAQAEADPQAFFVSLVESATRTLSEPVAAKILTVERTRSLREQLTRREGSIREIRLVSKGVTMILTCLPGPRFLAETRRHVGIVPVSRRVVPLGAWLEAFSRRIEAAARDAASDSAAQARALRALGIGVAVDVAVAEATVETDLRGLSARVQSRLPADATAQVGRISDVLLTTLPRLAGSYELDLIVRRAATIYLPDTLRAYLALPDDWARDHVFADGSTPNTILVAQLAVLEAAVRGMHEAAVSNDADALRINGRFLSARFGKSGLDLP